MFIELVRKLPGTHKFSVTPFNADISPALTPEEPQIASSELPEDGFVTNLLSTSTDRRNLSKVVIAVVPTVLGLEAVGAVVAKTVFDMDVRNLIPSGNNGQNQVGPERSVVVPAQEGKIYTSGEYEQKNLLHPAWDGNTFYLDDFTISSVSSSHPDSTFAFTVINPEGVYFERDQVMTIADRKVVETTGEEIDFYGRKMQALALLPIQRDENNVSFVSVGYRQEDPGRVITTDTLVAKIEPYVYVPEGKTTPIVFSGMTPQQANVEGVEMPLDFIDATLRPFLNLGIVPEFHLTRVGNIGKIDVAPDSLYDKKRTVAAGTVQEIGGNSVWGPEQTYDNVKAAIGAIGNKENFYATLPDVLLAAIDLKLVNDELYRRQKQLAISSLGGTDNQGELPVQPFMYMFSPTRYIRAENGSNQNFSREIEPYDANAAVSQVDRAAALVTTARYWAEDALSVFEDKVKSTDQQLYTRLLYTAVHNVLSSMAYEPEELATLLPDVMNKGLLLPAEQFKAFVAPLREA